MDHSVGSIGPNGCDENLVRLFFMQHGLQVPLDVTFDVLFETFPELVVHQASGMRRVPELLGRVSQKDQSVGSGQLR